MKHFGDSNRRGLFEIPILFFFSICGIVFPCVIGILLFPYELQAATLKGLVIWRDVLVPALFPFFVLVEIMLGLGVIHLLSKWLDPTMRLVFRMSGNSGVVLILGFLSGYPMAAKLISTLQKENQMSRKEAERLLGIATTADPIFIIGAIAIGLFQNESLASYLLFAHYGSSIILAIITRFFTKSYELSTLPLQDATNRQEIFKKTNILSLLKHALEHSSFLVFFIGGLVIFFCVYISLLTSIQWMNYFYSIVNSVISTFSANHSHFSLAIVDGFFEVTMGMNSIASDAAHTLGSQLVVASFLLSWAGLSVHAQIMSLLHGSTVRYLSFLLYRLFHGFIAMMITFILWHYLK
jgi:sporulation integral membrane protein YlbJ